LFVFHGKRKDVVLKREKNRVSAASRKELKREEREEKKDDEDERKEEEEAKKNRTHRVESARRLCHLHHFPI